MKIPSIIITTPFLPLRKAIKTKKKQTWRLQDRYQYQGLPLSIENKAGSWRRSKIGEKPKWKTKMGYDYGYIRNTLAEDDDAVDAYVNKKSKGMRENYHQKEGEPEMIPADVYVVHQLKIWHSGKWYNGICPDCGKHNSECKCSQHHDEDKVMLGFSSKEEAIKAYLKQYDSPRFLGPVSTYTLLEFKAALKRSWGKKLPTSESKHEHWIGVDIDGTLFKDEGWKGINHFGEIVKKMKERIEKLLSQGKKVKIFTARAWDKKAIQPIKDVLKLNGLPDLEITNIKDPGMVNLYDDRAVQVRKNTGNLVKSIVSTYYIDFEKACSETHKSMLGTSETAGQGGVMYNFLEENIRKKAIKVNGTVLGKSNVPYTMDDAVKYIEGTYEQNKQPGEALEDYYRRTLRDIKDVQTDVMISRDQRGLVHGDLEKAYVKAHTRKGKKVGPYFTKTRKKVAVVKHKQLTRVDYGKKDAEKKIASLHKKKEHHDLHIESAKELKDKVIAHKRAGNSKFMVGKKEHHVDKVLNDLNDHIEHHTNEKRSHDNHIRKIENRHKTEARHFEKQKKVKSEKAKLRKEAKGYDKAKEIIRSVTGSEKITEGDVYKVMFAAKKKGDDSYTHVNNFLMGTRPDLNDAVNEAGMKLDQMPSEPKKAEVIDQMIKDGEHDGEKFSDDLMGVLKKMKLKSFPTEKQAKTAVEKTSREVKNIKSQIKETRKKLEGIKKLDSNKKLEGISTKLKEVKKRKEDLKAKAAESGEKIKALKARKTKTIAVPKEKEIKKESFTPSVGDTVYIHWEATNSMKPVNYRGRTGDKAMVVFKDGSQMFVPFKNLKPKSDDKPIEIIKPARTEVPGKMSNADKNEFRNNAIQEKDHIAFLHGGASERKNRTDLKVGQSVYRYGKGGKHEEFKITGFKKPNKTQLAKIGDDSHDIAKQNTVVLEREALGRKITYPVKAFKLDKDSSSPDFFTKDHTTYGYMVK